MTAAPTTYPLLIVDDHADTGAMVVRAAGRRGIAGQAILWGSHAVGCIERNHSRVVVLDEFMPDVSGLDVLRAIRRDPRTQDVHVIFYTACYDWQKQRDASHLGVLAWLVKGVD